MKGLLGSPEFPGLPAYSTVQYTRTELYSSIEVVLSIVCVVVAWREYNFKICFSHHVMELVRYC